MPTCYHDVLLASRENYGVSTGFSAGFGRRANREGMIEITDNRFSFGCNGYRTILVDLSLNGRNSQKQEYS